MSGVLVVALYELGRPPSDAISLANSLRADGLVASWCDLAVDDWSEEFATCDLVVFLVPMHTAARLVVEAAARLRAERPALPTGTFGLYAHVAGPQLESSVDRSFGPDQYPELLRWAQEAKVARVASGAPAADVVRETSADGRGKRADLTKYARLSINDELRIAGSVGASSGCLHRCRHCPVPVGFDGRIRLSPADDLLAEIDRQVESGATHISFSDPDFLNARSHSTRIVRALHERHPTMTFDCTVKVEHILKYPDIWDEFARLGCLFVISAFECVDDRVLEILDKGHVAADCETALRILRSAGIEVRPSFLPFTPWSSLGGIGELFAFVEQCDLIDSIDAVQLAIRLLVPVGSLLVDHAEMRPHLGSYDAAAMTYSWTSADPRVDALQVELAKIAESGSVAAEPPRETYARMRSAVEAALAAAGIEVPFGGAIPFGSIVGRPRMTESWFC